MDPDTSNRRESPQELPATTPGQPGHTTVRRELDNEPEPRLPHERDESADSQGGAPRDIMRQAQADVARGLVDTDRTVPMEEVYDRELRSDLVPSDRGASASGSPVEKPGRREGWRPSEGIKKRSER